ncbi:hypothetical protein STEG23_013192, partial [Scotinomys teguina]
MWSKRNTPPLLVEMQIVTTTLESSMANSQKIGNHSSSKPSHTTLGHIPKECPVIQQGHMLNYVHSIIVIARTWKQPRCPSTEEWIRKMWYKHTMVYYTAEKNNDIMKFAGKWMELENVILNKQIYEDSNSAYEEKSPSLAGGSHPNRLLVDLLILEKNSEAHHMLKYV